MKILFLEHPEPDYGSSQLYTGLYQNLGENIIDFPYKYCHHGQIEKLQNIDIKTFMSDNPEVFPNGGYSTAFPWESISKSAEYHYDDIKSMIKKGEFDFIIMTPRAVSIYYLKRLTKDLNDNIPPVILCDFEDYNDIRYDILEMFKDHIKLITKSSYHPDNLGVFQKHRTGKEKIQSLQLSSALIDNPGFRFDDKNKTIDIHARLGLTRDLRKEIIKSLKSIEKHTIVAAGYPDRERGIEGKNITATLDEHVPYIQYLQEIAKSKISVSMRGHGLIGVPMRYWEIPSYETLMLCEQQNCIYEHPFEDGKTCIFFNSEIKDDIIKKALYWLHDDQETERKTIAKAGHEHLKKYHTCKARANRLLEIVKEET